MEVKLPGGPEHWRVISVAAGGRHSMVLALPDNGNLVRRQQVEVRAGHAVHAVHAVARAVRAAPARACLALPAAEVDCFGGWLLTAAVACHRPSSLPA